MFSSTECNSYICVCVSNVLVVELGFEVVFCLLDFAVLFAGGHGVDFGEENAEIVPEFCADVAHALLHQPRVYVPRGLGEHHCKADDHQTPKVLQQVEDRSGLSLNNCLAGGEDNVHSHQIAEIIIELQRQTELGEGCAFLSVLQEDGDGQLHL